MEDLEMEECDYSFSENFDEYIPVKLSWFEILESNLGPTGAILWCVAVTILTAAIIGEFIIEFSHIL